MFKDDIIKVLDAIGVSKYTPGRKNFQVSCPLSPWLHPKGRDSHPSMGIKVTGEPGPALVHCYGCDFGGTFTMLVEALANYDSDTNYTDAIQLVRDFESIEAATLVDSIPAYEEAKAEEKPQHFDRSLLFPYLNSSYISRGQRYLSSRGIDEKTAHQWSIGWDNDWEAVTVPVFDVMGKLVGMEGRFIDPTKKQRFHDYWHWDKRKHLIGEQLYFPGTTLIVVEGLFDAIHLWQLLRDAGLLHTYSVVSTLGSSVTDEQKLQIVRLAEDVILFLDLDEQGRKARHNLIGYLSTQVICRAILHNTVFESSVLDLSLVLPLIAKKVDPDLLISEGILTRENLWSFLRSAPLVTY